MEDLLRQLISRAEAEGGTEWLCRGLEHPPHPSEVPTGSSGPEAYGVEERPLKKKSVVQESRKKMVKDEERKRVAPKSFYNWIHVFCIYGPVLGEKQPHHCSGLFPHL